MADLSQIAKVIRTVRDAVPAVLTGTVAGVLADNKLSVVLDNDPSGATVSAVSLIGVTTLGSTSQAVGARVMCLRYPPRGLAVIGYLNPPAPVASPNVITRTFFVNGDWTRPTDPNFRGVWVELQAGGGGSGACSATTAAQTSGAGGGGGGGYARFWVPASDLVLATETVVSGAGGAGGTAPGGNGVGGGSSRFGTVTFGQIAGGAGGTGGGTGAPAASTQNGGATFQAFTGSVTQFIQIQGGDGGTGFRFANSLTALPGYGGGSANAGQSRVQPIVAGVITALAGWAYGGGSAAPANMGVIAVAQAGGAGADGVVYVHEYYY